MSAPAILEPVTKTINPTWTELVRFDVRALDQAAITLSHASASQTLVSRVKWRMDETDTWSIAPISDFDSISPGSPPVLATFPVVGVAQVMLESYFSGAGGEAATARCFGGFLL